MDKTYIEIRKRYSEESKSCSTLGCGNNLEFLDIKHGEKILDIGCGSGMEAIAAALKTGPSGMVAGLDLTSRMIERARENAAKSNVENIFFIAGEVENMPFKDCSFDSVVSNCAINHAKDKNRAYSEIYRIMKSGGVFVISDAVTSQPLPREIKNDPEAWAQCFGGAITEDEYLKIITIVGFKEINILKRREYKKNSYDFISLTISARKA